MGIGWNVQQELKSFPSKGCAYINRIHRGIASVVKKLLTIFHQATSCAGAAQVTYLRQLRRLNFIRLGRCSVSQQGVNKALEG